MNNQVKEEDYIRQFINELGTEAPSVGFHKNILAKLDQKSITSTYKPVISPLAWKIISGVVASIFFAVLLFIPGESTPNPLISELFYTAVPKQLNSIPGLFSPTVNLSPVVMLSLLSFFTLAFLTVITSVKNRRFS